MQAPKTQIFGYLWHLLLFSIENAFFKAQMWQKAEEYVPKQVCQFSTAQVIVTGKIFHQIFPVCSWLPIKYKHLKLRFLATFGTCYSSQMPSRSSRLKCGKKLRNTSPSRFVSTALHKSLLQAKYVEYCM